MGKQHYIKKGKGIALWEKAKRLIPGGNQLLSKRAEMFLPGLWPAYYAKAKGIEVTDLDGRVYLDFSIMGIGACALGYANKKVNGAVKQAVERGSMSTLNAPEEVELAEVLLSLHPWAKKVRYARTGGEAMAIAVRIARAHSGKDKVAFCYDKDTEVLTRSGFKRFFELNQDEEVATLNPETHELEYHKIERKVEYAFKGKMLHFRGQRVDLLVTPDHQIYRKFRLRKGFRFGFSAASNLLERSEMTQMTSTCKWKTVTDSKKFTIPSLNQTRPTKNLTTFGLKDFVVFMGWYLTEGCCITRKNRKSYEISISQDEKNTAKSTEIFTAIKRLGFIPFRNSHHICFSSKELYLYLKQFGLTKVKFIPQWIKELPREYLEVFIDAMIKGDGCFEKGRIRRFYSTSKQLIDGMQEILLKAGYSTTISEVNSNGFSKGKIFHLNIGREEIIGSYPTEEYYNGNVYCVTVPNHIILVRRNGKIVWSGNCGYHGWSDWYLATNLADAKGLNEHLLSGLDPAGVPQALRGTILPFAYNHIDELKALLKKHKDIGVIVVETVRHHEPEGSFLEQVRALATKAGAVLIFDEITVGWRVALGGAHLSYGVYPDIAVLGKAIANGYAMAAIIGTEDVMDSAQKTFISSTFWTERIGPAAALATIREMKRVNLPAYLKRVGSLIGDGWKRSAEKHGLKIRVHGPEALVGFAFDYGEKSQAIRTLFTQEMLRRGFLASGSVYVSYAHTKKHVKKYLSAVDEVFALLAEAIKKNTVTFLLQGPVAHSGFQRLT